MTERTALIIAYYFPPMGLSGVQRTLKFVKYLPEYGWKPVVLTSTPSSYYAFDDSLEQDLSNNEIEIYRTEPRKSKEDNFQKPKTSKFRSHFVQKLGQMALQSIYQPDSKVYWKKPAIELGEQIIKRLNVDVIFATAPPFTDFLVARELSKKFDIPFIVDYRDVWIDNPFHFYLTPFHKSYSINLERDVLTHASKAIAITRYTKELLVKRYRFLSHDDVAIIPHGYDPQDFEPLSEIKPSPSKFVITHSGLFQDNRTPKFFLKALSAFLEKNPDAKAKIEARFVGIMRPNHHKLVKKYKLTENVVFTGYMNHSDSIKQLLESDVLWFMLKDTVRSPGKLYEYFGAKKPILACVPEGIIRKITLDTNAAIATNPKDVKAIESAIATFYEQWKKHSLPKPKPEYIAQFNRKNLSADLARELSLCLEL